jgi:hypothetical protein
MAKPTPNNPTGAQKSPKLTPDTISKLEQAFAIDATVGEACFYADISHDTYYRWIKDYPELSEKFERLRKKPILKARQTIVNDLDNTDSAKWYLKNKKNNEFNEKVIREDTVKNVNVDLTDKERELLHKALKNKPIED